MRTALVLVVLALHLVPVAIAQGPQVCGPLSASVAPTPTVAPGEAARVEVTVTNGGNNPVQTTVSASTASPGWRLTGDEDKTATIPAGGESTFTFDAVADETANGAGTVNFSIMGTCPLPIGQCPAGQCDAAPVNASAQVGYRAPEGFRVPGLEGLGFPVEYLVAGILLVGIATAVPLLMRSRRRGRAVLEAPEPLKLLRPGRGTSFPIEIRNAGNEPLTARMEVSSAPEGWSAFLPLSDIQVAPTEARRVWLMARAPETAKAGDALDLEVRLWPAGAQRPVTTRIRAEVDPSATEADNPL